ncbi:MAG: flippase [Paludibacteraceae bacterium]|jgi:PST family polysaccharide transporter|nr:flippase [Paludibacteraceae bacterium]
MRKLSNLKDNVLFVNISSQGLVQFANYLIPLLLIPYVTRVLGPDAFGRASYAQNIGAYLTLLVNYGFEFSATQEVSIHKNNPAKVQSIFSTVIAFKFALFVLSLALVAGLAAVDYRVREDFSSVLIVSLVNFGWVLFPTWFFQGIEHMVKMSVFSFFVKLFGALLVIAMVHRPSDYQLYLLGLTLANVCVGGYSFYYVMHKYGVRLERPQPFGSAQVVRKGFPIFINTILVNCNTMLGIYVMGRYLTDAEIGAYSGAQKIIMAVMMITCQTVTIALFPRISSYFHESKEKGLAYLKKCILLISIFSLAVSAVTFLLAPLVVSILLGNDFSDAVFLLRLLSPLTFLMTMATTLTVQGLYGMQLQRFAPLIGLAVCVCSVSLNCVLIPKEGAAGSVYAWLVCELVEISIAVGLLWWKKDAK